MLRNSVRSFAEKEIAPLVEEAEREQKFPRKLFRKLGELGYLCVSFPPEYGGAGTDLVSECIVIEEIARINCGIAASINVHGGLVFEDCRVPEENLVGEEGKGFRYLMGTLTRGRITHAATSVGGARAAFAEALKYAKEREELVLQGRFREDLSFV